MDELQLSDSVKQLVLCDSGFVFEPSKGSTFTANETGLCILRLFQQNLALDEVVEQLTAQYSIVPSDARNAVLAYQKQIHRFLA